MRFSNRFTLLESKKASVSSRIRKDTFVVKANEYWRAREAIDFSPPDNCSRSYTNLLVGGVGLKYTPCSNGYSPF